MNLAAEFCDRLILLKGGKVFMIGTPTEVITRENIETVYGCRVWVDQNPVSKLPRITLLKKEGRP
jgi:iron complex transport system ATP-binding protein